MENNTRYMPSPPYTDDELVSIRECCSTLITQWSVVRGKDKASQKMWDMIANPRYRQRIRENLADVNFELVIIEAHGKQVAYIQGGTKVAQEKFHKTESIVLLRMRQILRANNTKVSLLQTGCMTDVRDLLAAVGAYQKVKVTEKDLKQILYEMERWNLCVVEEKRKKDFSLDTPIRILPSVEFAFKDKPDGWEEERLNLFKQERDRGGASTTESEEEDE